MEILEQHELHKEIKMLTIVDAIQYQYPNAIALGQVGLMIDEGKNYSIISWSIPNVPQPTIQSLQDYLTQNYLAISVNSFSLNVTPLLQNLIDNTASQKQYADGVSCASYVSSTNVTWRSQAVAFIAWRDSVFNYVYSQLPLYQNGSLGIPDMTQPGWFETLAQSLPPMVWPIS
jgi:hypothetical protein